MSIRKLLQVPPTTSLPTTRFSPGLFIVLQEMLDQSSFAVIRLFNLIFEENKIFSFSSLLVGSDFAVLLICFLQHFLYSSAIKKLGIKSCFCFFGFQSFKLILPP